MSKPKISSAPRNERMKHFIQQAKAKYGNDYDYSLVIDTYKNNRTRVNIICNRCTRTFSIIPFVHVSKGNNKGTCQHCHIKDNKIQERRWDPNLPKRIKEFKKRLQKKYGRIYNYPHIENEYKNESSLITVQCTTCHSKPYKLKACSLKSKTRQGGCKECTKTIRAQIIAEKNRERQLRNYSNIDKPKPYGCIYKITNPKNGKFYIGYTSMSAKKRFKAHCDEAKQLEKGVVRAKSYLHNAMIYHGYNSFNVEIIQEFENVSVRYLGEIEKSCIQRLKPKYNLTEGGELANYGAYI